MITSSGLSSEQKDLKAGCGNEGLSDILSNPGETPDTNRRSDIFHEAVDELDKIEADIVKAEIPNELEEISKEVDQTCDIPFFFEELNKGLDRSMNDIDAERKAEIGEKSVVKSEQMAHINMKVSMWTTMISDACSERLDVMDELKARVSEI